MFATVFTVIFAVLAVLSTLIGVLKSRKFHFSEALVRIFLVIIALILTIVLTSAFAFKISNLLVEPIEAFLEGVELTQVSEILNEVQAAETTLAIVISMIITPVFFILCFNILKGIFHLALARPINKLCLLIAGKIAKKDYISEIYGSKELSKKEKKEFRKKKFTLAAAICGAVCGLLVFTITLIPIIGTAETLASVGKNVDENSPVHDISDNITNHPATSIMHPISNPVWQNFTYYTINGEQIVIEDEAHFVAVFVQALSEMSSSDPETFRHSAEIFRSLSTLCPNTSLVPCLCSDFINAANAHWTKGEDFANISMPQDELVLMLVQCLDNSTPDTMREDLVTVSNVLAILAENAYITEDNKIDTQALLEDKVVISKLSVELLKNERLAPVVGKLVKQQVEANDSKLDLPEQDGEEYNELVDNILNTYQENVAEDITEESLNNLSNAVGNVLEDKGIVLEEHEKVAIASTFISEFGDPSQLTPEMVSNLIEQYRKNQ